MVRETAHPLPLLLERVLCLLQCLRQLLLRKPGSRIRLLLLLRLLRLLLAWRAVCCCRLLLLLLARRLAFVGCRRTAGGAARREPKLPAAGAARG